MTPFLLLAGAVLLVAFGGLMAAIDAALSVTSRADLVEMGSGGRNAGALAKIAADPDPHANSVAFMRVFVETAAAVLVTVAFVLLLGGQIWWAMLAAVVIMTATTFVLVGASPRFFGRLHSDAMLRVCAPTIRAVRLILGPIAQGLAVFGGRVTPGAGRAGLGQTGRQPAEKTPSSPSHFHRPQTHAPNTTHTHTHTHTRSCSMSSRGMCGNISATLSTTCGGGGGGGGGVRA